jgi:hypothetical protein
MAERWRKYEIANQAMGKVHYNKVTARLELALI